MIWSLLELPPRARRIPVTLFYGASSTGTTSACAENTSGLSVLPGSLGNYLRVRGEYCSMWIDFAAHSELPPRARRIHAAHASCTSSSGTTSACAENTGPPEKRAFACWNYLRVRGEYISTGVDEGAWGELPPRARRIHKENVINELGFGTTSACAENTPEMHPVFPPQRNYLRVRGEYAFFCGVRRRCWELPPRARRIQ